MYHWGCVKIILSKIYQDGHVKKNGINDRHLSGIFLIFMLLGNKTYHTCHFIAHTNLNIQFYSLLVVMWRTGIKINIVWLKSPPLSHLWKHLTQKCIIVILLGLGFLKCVKACPHAVEHACVFVCMNNYFQDSKI